MDLATLMRNNFSENGFPVEERVDALKRLYCEIKNRCGDIQKALFADYNKNSFDAYATEVGVVLSELRHTIRNLKKWTRKIAKHLSIINFPSKGRIYPEPYGVVLVIAPWNYPFGLSMCPLIGAIAAGNYVVLKPSTKTKNTAKIIDEILQEVFSGGKVRVTDSREILSMRWDYIFFTGSPKTGKDVMRSAAEFLTPVTLELGGKSPCIVDESADIPRAAKRIAWGKFINAGQTCVAPDYLLVHNSVKEQFINSFIKEIKMQYYIDNKLTNDFTYVINEEKVKEVLSLIEGEKILFGGKAEGRALEPTVIEADFESPIMRDEIFAPVAPIIGYDDLNDAIKEINKKEKPLALYYFGKKFNEINSKVSYGGGCHNDVIMHVAENKLPFGGVGNSGMGSYHGKKSFDTFTHYKSVLVKGKAELKLRYAPHNEKKEKLAKKIFK
ncbi:aldehyde dehydrogenase [Holotrichia oblita]|nr:aldehyde dehydrogenase [Holotrichia oblita]